MARRGSPIVNTYGLLAAAPVKWLLGNEPDVSEEVRKFIRDERESELIEVATPPSISEIVSARRTGRPLMLPQITLKLRMVPDHFNGPHVEVTCSDEDMEVIVEMAIAKNVIFERSLLQQAQIEAKLSS